MFNLRSLLIQSCSFLFLWTAVSCLPSIPSRPTAKTGGPATRDEHLALGNPSGASQSDPNNYLLSRPGYTLSYNRDRNTANWVSWHLSSAWKGSSQRSNDFRPDAGLPSDWYRVRPSDYSNTGYDRGHLCPSDDRDASPEENAATFMMTNIVPQAPRHNREVWKSLEDYCRQLAGQGNELYIMAGVQGTGGTGAEGYRKYIADRNVTVPASLWKVIVVLPIGTEDARRITPETRVIAVNIPNRQSAADKPWEAYQLSVDELEDLTGYDFLSALPTDLQRQIEGRNAAGKM